VQGCPQAFSLGFKVSIVLKEDLCNVEMPFIDSDVKSGPVFLVVAVHVSCKVPILLAVEGILD